MENIKAYVAYKNRCIDNSSFNMESLFELIHDQGDRVFCEHLEKYQVKEISYTEFKTYCLKMASYLKDEIGDERGSFVGIYMENSVNWIATLWGLLMIGYKPMLLNCKLPNSINEEIINTLKIKTVVATSNALNVTKTVLLSAKQGMSPEIQKCNTIGEKTWEDNVALSTTATSLDYKICVFTGEELTFQAKNTKRILIKNENMRGLYKGMLKQLAFLPFYHVFGLTAVYFWFAIYGRTFVFLNDYSSETIMNTIRRHKVTHVFAVPLLWNTMAREIKKEMSTLSSEEQEKAEKGMKLCLKMQNAFPKLGQKFARKVFEKIASKTMGDSIKFLISGGGYVAKETLELLNSVGYPLYNGYGATEIGITSVELRKKPKYRIMGTVGTAFETIEYKVDEGTLRVRGKSICSTIIHRNGDVEKLQKDSWYDTRDNAKIDKDGYVYICGREDDVVIASNGEKINPDIIEEDCLLTRVENYAVIGLAGKLTLIFQVDSNSNELKLMQIVQEITENLERLKNLGYQIEQVFFTNDQMVNKNAIKVSRAALLKKIESGEVKLKPFSEFKAKENFTEDEISADVVNRVKLIFAEILGKSLEEIDDDNHFIFDLGGTSLDYCSVLMKLKEEFNVEFNFENESCATAKEFANFIINKEKGAK